MPVLQIGGADVAEGTCTMSWGLAPGSGTLTCPGSVSVAVEDGVSIDFGGVTFHGLVSSVVEVEEDGLRTVISVVDNRIKLMWDVVFGRFNQVEIIEDDLATEGVDRKKRYAHIYPADWATQKVTRTATPKKVTEIIEKLLAAATVNVAWDTVTVAEQEKPLLDIDWNNGIKLGTALQELSDRQGLLFTLEDEDTIKWVRKGEGTLPTAPAASSTNRGSGDSLSHHDTRITLVGGRNLYQNHVDLEPDWVDALQDFWSAPLWWAEVKRVFGPFDETPAGAAEWSAKARSVTLREYNEHELAVESYDARRWGEVSRMEIPVWVYLQDIVFKAYRIPLDYTFGGAPLDSLEISEKGLLAAVEHDPDYGTFDLLDPRELYPETKAYVIAQGQDLGLLDIRTQGVITPAQIDRAQDTWVRVNRFDLDIKGKAIHFHDPVVLPGSGEDGLFIFPNVEMDGIDEDHPLASMMVPNANATVEPAPVRAVLVFEAEPYSMEFGSGDRYGVHLAKDISRHAVYDLTVLVEEIKDADDKTADERAAEEAAGLIAREAIYADGGYRRHGACGTPLTGVVDRVTVTVNFSEGLTEDVEFTKERLPVQVESAREQDRRARGRELFPGQEENRTEVRRLRQIAELSKVLPRRAPSPYASVAEVLEKPVGAFQATVQLATLEAATAAGAPLFAKDAGGYPTDVFLGILLADQSTGSQCAAALDGPVPVRIQGPFVAGDSIYVRPVGEDAVPPVLETDLEDFGRVGGGGRFLGKVNADYTGTAVVVAPVILGGGGGAAALLPLQPYVATEGETPKVGLAPGTFGSNAELNPGDAVPTIGGTRIDAVTPPKLTLTAGDRLLYLAVTVDGDGKTTSVTVEHTADEDPPAPTLYTIFYVRLCTLTVSGATVTLGTYELGGSKTFELCGGTNPVWAA